jgi:hypothetical protein
VAVHHRIGALITKLTPCHAAAAVAVGVAAFAGVPGASAAGSIEPVVCTGTIENTVVGDVTVPYNESCTLRNVIVAGSVVAELEALAVTLDGAIVAGDVAVESRRFDVRRAVVAGDI